MPHLRPTSDALVIDPATGNPLPKGGAEVPLSTYWIRRLRDGSVAEVPHKASPEPPTATEPQPEPRSRPSRGRSRT